MSRYVVLVERSEDGFGAWCPDLPGCVAVGDTVPETIEEMRGAIRFHLDGLREEGLPVPAPSTVASSEVEAA
ncbi:type II toxin-antitoxin system HicB family antitoxin [Nocardiopsis suaedae]|uniref:Type II toxin-antitoxin system HicB family antitoxin n=1 Tax=Nocardiopsis suaedae TaxID=3018444 RepID=A0ABT4TJS4_9ACTN|nr:type II toxin-antitoxin system HicB family antitoxin [Nocardiopsis suaedae]MDA2804938.1 type II toxin-antitoxin system HicB family antitoxin [Nocardiopsis suaedae]